MEQYPEPDVPYAGHSDLHFATERQVRSGLTLAGFDRGELTMSPGRVTFRGMTVLVDCTDVSAVRLVRKAFPWATLLVVAVLDAVMAVYQDPHFFNLRRMSAFGPVGALLVAVAVLYSGEKWVEVEYPGADGPRRAYFRREGLFKGARRTRRLLDEIEATVLRRAGLCPACGYDLTGNASGVCPECGRGTRPVVATSRRPTP